MTKEEILMFVEQNKYYEIGTDHGVVSGKVLIFSDTALIVQQINGRKKMIEYVKIGELEEIDEPGQTMQSAQTMQQVQEIQSVQTVMIDQDRANLNTVLVNMADCQRKAFPSSSVPVQSMMSASISAGNPCGEYDYQKYLKDSYSFIFKDDFTYTYDRDEIKKLFKENKQVQKRWSSVFAMFNDSIKNHAFNEKYARIIDETNMIINRYPDFLPLYCFLGHIYYQKEKLAEAALQFEKGQDYYNALAAGQQAGSFDRVLAVLIALCEKQQTESARNNAFLRNAFYYAGILKKGNVILRFIEKHSELLLDAVVQHGLFYLADCYDLGEKIDWNKGRDTAGLFEILKKELESETDIIPVIVQPDTKEKKMDLNSNMLKGRITNYGDKGSKVGFINNKIYFYITQVEDYELRKRLLEGCSYNLDVYYTLGINYKGDVAADHIIPVSDNELEKAVRNEEQEIEFSGYICEYNRGWYAVGRKKELPPGTGKVCRNIDGEKFTFYPNIEMDPDLEQDIEEAFKVEEMDVSFTLKNNNGKVVVASMGRPGYKHKYLLEKARKITYGEIPDYEELKKIPEIKEQTEEYRLVTTDSLKDKVIDKVNTFFFDENTRNPFEHLGSLNETGNFYKGCQFVSGYKDASGNRVGRDLNKAEDHFIRAIQSKDNMDASISSLVNLYLQKGGETNLVKGMQLLAVYGIYLQHEKLLDLLIQLVDKSGKAEPICILLEHAVRENTKCNKVLDYMIKLADAYQKRKEWKMCRNWYEKTLDYAKQNRFMFKQDNIHYNSVRFRCQRGIILATYHLDNLELAIQLSKELLKEVPEDNLASSIVNGDFQNLNMDLDSNDVKFNELELPSDNNLSGYESFLLNQVNLTELIGRFAKIYPKIKDNRYTGTSSEAEKDIDDIFSKIGKGNIAIKTTERSEYLLGIAQIALCSRENETKEEKISIETIKTYLGRSMFYRAEYVIQSYKDIDTARFFYIEALKNLRTSDNITIINSLNRLIYSFFIQRNALESETRQSVRYPKEQIEKYFGQKCISIKDFLIMISLLRDKQDYVELIQRKVYEEEILRNSIIEWCKNRPFIHNSEFEIRTDLYGFEMLLKQVQSVYSKYTEEIRREMESCVREYRMQEKLVQHLSKLKELLNMHFLLNLDESRLKEFINIMELFVRNQDIQVQMEVDDRAEHYQDIHNRLQILINDIEKLPSELSFYTIRSSADDFVYIVVQEMDRLFLSTKPEINEISLLSETFYVDNNNVRLTICISNQKFKQAADGVQIQILSDESRVQMIECQKTFQTIHSGEKQEYIAVFQLDETTVQEKQFDISVQLKYSYRIGYERTEDEMKIEKLNVNLNSKESFEQITNKYEKIYRGSGVTIPEMFKGRNQLIDSICKSMDLGNGIMNKNRGIILWGQKRVGKNSVKDYLKQAIMDTYGDAYIPIELGSVGKCGSLRGILITIANQTQLALMKNNRELFQKYLDAGLMGYSKKIESATEYMAEFTNYMNLLSYLIQTNSEPEKNILLYYFDEFSYLYEWIENGELDGKVFMRFWKSFIQDYGICAIIIAQDVIPVWRAQYENEFACMNYANEITYLMPDGARELICDPCMLNGKSRFSPEAVEYIYSLTKGSAYLIVILCKSIIDYLNATYTEKVTKAIVEIVMEKEFIDKKGIFERADFEPQIVDPSQVGTAAERNRIANTKILREIAEKTMMSAKTEINGLQVLRDEDAVEHKKAFERLRERKIIDVEAEYCSISMPLLKFYYLREQGILSRELLNNV